MATPATNYQEVVGLRLSSNTTKIIFGGTIPNDVTTITDDSGVPRVQISGLSLNRCTILPKLRLYLLQGKPMGYDYCYGVYLRYLYDAYVVIYDHTVLMRLVDHRFHLPLMA